MRKSSIVIAGIVLVFAFIIVGSRMTGRATDGPGQYDKFAQCLAEKGVTMYGAFWCPHCENQKKMFGNSWRYINYVECDPRGDNANPQLCKQMGISGYPTWVFADGSRVSGELSFRELEFRSGCSLDAE